MGAEVFHALKSVLKAKGLNTAVGDEGGFAPNLASNEDAIKTILEAIEKAGYKPGKDIKLAMDVASSEFYHDGKYVLPGEGNREFTSKELVDFYDELCSKYPIISIEDGLDQDDWEDVYKRQHVPRPTIGIFIPLFKVIYFISYHLIFYNYFLNFE